MFLQWKNHKWYFRCMTHEKERKLPPLFEPPYHQDDIQHLHITAQAKLKSMKESLAVTAHIPEHKIYWYAQAIDTIMRALEAAESQGLSAFQLDEMIRNQGFYELKHIDTWANEMFHRESNWSLRITPDGETIREYRGPEKNRVWEYYYKGSYFDNYDFHNILQTLLNDRTIQLSEHRFYLPRHAPKPIR